MKIRFAILCSIVLFIVSCSEEEDYEKGVYIQNFEGWKYWKAESSITDSTCHTGVYCTQLGSWQEYSPTFIMPYKEIADKKYRIVKVTAWGRLPESDADVKMVIAIDAPGIKNISWVSSQFVANNKWQKTEVHQAFPDEQLPEGTEFKVYAWTSNKKGAFIDDVKITFIK